MIWYNIVRSFFQRCGRNDGYFIWRYNISEGNCRYEIGVLWLKCVKYERMSFHGMRGDIYSVTRTTFPNPTTITYRYSGFFKPWEYPALIFLAVSSNHSKHLRERILHVVIHYLPRFLPSSMLGKNEEPYQNWDFRSNYGSQMAAAQNVEEKGSGMSMCKSMHNNKADTYVDPINTRWLRKVMGSIRT